MGVRDLLLNFRLKFFGCRILRALCEGCGFSYRCLRLSLIGRCENMKSDAAEPVSLKHPGQGRDCYFFWSDSK
jgi:hypothetical protein